MASKKSIGVSKTMPQGEARPLGTKAKRAAKILKHPSVVEKVVDSPAPSLVESSQSSAMTPTQSTAVSGDTHMDVTLTKDTKVRKSTSIVYNGAGIRGGVRIAKSAFIDGNAPETLVVSSDVFAQPKAKLTAAERKAARAAAPKPTLAEKIAKREAQLAKMRSQLSTAGAAASL